MVTSEDDGLRRLRFRIWQVSITAVTVLATAWFFTLGMLPGIIDVHSEVTWTVDDSKYKPSAPDAVFPFGQV